MLGPVCSVNVSASDSRPRPPIELFWLEEFGNDGFVEIVVDDLIDRAVTRNRFNSGRSVHRQPAIIPAPGSIVDHMAMLVACQKKSSTWVSPSTYLNRIIEQMLPRPARERMNPTESLERRPIWAFHKIKMGRMAKMQSVMVVKPAC